MQILLAFLSGLLFVTSSQAANTYGKGAFTETPIALAKVVENFEQYKDKTVVVSAEVKEVCTKEGCWMKIQDDKVLVRAIMRDHGFKVPVEIKDKVVLVEGKLVQKELPANAVKHFMKDEGKPQSEIDKVKAPQKVFQFVAEAVKVG